MVKLFYVSAALTLWLSVSTATPADIIDGDSTTLTSALQKRQQVVTPDCVYGKREGASVPPSYDYALDQYYQMGTLCWGQAYHDDCRFFVQGLYNMTNPEIPQWYRSPNSNRGFMSVAFADAIYDPPDALVCGIPWSANSWVGIIKTVVEAMIAKNSTHACCRYELERWYGNWSSIIQLSMGSKKQIYFPEDMDCPSTSVSTDSLAMHGNAPSFGDPEQTSADHLMPGSTDLPSAASTGGLGPSPTSKHSGSGDHKSTTSSDHEHTGSSDHTSTATSDKSTASSGKASTTSTHHTSAVSTGPTSANSTDPTHTVSTGPSSAKSTDATPTVSTGPTSASSTDHTHTVSSDHMSTASSGPTSTNTSDQKSSVAGDHTSTGSGDHDHKSTGSGQRTPTGSADHTSGSGNVTAS